MNNNLEQIKRNLDQTQQKLYQTKRSIEEKTKLLNQKVEEWKNIKDKFDYCVKCSKDLKIEKERYTRNINSVSKYLCEFQNQLQKGLVKGQQERIIKAKAQSCKFEIENTKKKLESSTVNELNILSHADTLYKKTNNLQNEKQRLFVELKLEKDLEKLLTQNVQQETQKYELTKKNLQEPLDLSLKKPSTSSNFRM